MSKGAGGGGTTGMRHGRLQHPALGQLGDAAWPFETAMAPGTPDDSSKLAIGLKLKSKVRVEVEVGQRGGAGRGRGEKRGPIINHISLNALFWGLLWVGREVGSG